MLLCVTLSLTPQKEDNALYTYVARDVSALFICRERGLRAFFDVSRKKWIRALRPEKNCA